MIRETERRTLARTKRRLSSLFVIAVALLAMGALMLVAYEPYHELVLALGSIVK